MIKYYKKKVVQNYIEMKIRDMILGIGIMKPNLDQLDLIRNKNRKSHLKI